MGKTTKLLIAAILLLIVMIYLNTSSLKMYTNAPEEKAMTIMPEIMASERPAAPVFTRPSAPAFENTDNGINLDGITYDPGFILDCAGIRQDEEECQELLKTIANDDEAVKEILDGFKNDKQRKEFTNKYKDLLEQNDQFNGINDRAQSTAEDIYNAKELMEKVRQQQKAE